MSDHIHYPAGNATRALAIAMHEHDVKYPVRGGDGSLLLDIAIAVNIVSSAATATFATLTFILLLT